MPKYTVIQSVKWDDRPQPVGAVVEMPSEIAAEVPHCVQLLVEDEKPTPLPLTKKKATP